MKRIMLTVLAILLWMGSAYKAEAQLIVIANPNVRTNEISRNDLRDIFTGTVTTLPDGNQVIPVLLKPGTEYEEFLQIFIGKSDTEYRAGWRALVFAGKTSMPLRLEPDNAVVDFVAHHNGAIGYINETSPHQSVKVLVVK
jgi:ABC-type phosphate transport system substrate-binding protein